MYREARWQHFLAMASIGYAHVPTREQNPDGRDYALSAFSPQSDGQKRILSI